MNKKIFALLAGIIILFSSQSVKAQELNLTEIQEATCKVCVNGSGWMPESGEAYGTGTVIKHDEANHRYFILTNAHVVLAKGRNPGIHVEFFRKGFISKPILAHIESVNFTDHSSKDMAVLSIPDSVFNNTGIKVRVIPLAPANFVLAPKMLIYGSGCPDSFWCQSWYARLIDIAPSSLSMTFNMPPCGGQSGSGVLTTVTDSQGQPHTALVGIVTWRFKENATFGGGVSLYRIYDILSGKPHSDKVSIDCVYAVGEEPTDMDLICDKCGHAKKEHFGYFNSITGEMARDTDGKASIWCPSYNTNSIDKNKWLKVQYGCPQCPNGQCPYWNGQQNPNQPPYNMPPQQLPFNNQPPDITSPWPNDLEREQGQGQGPVQPPPGPVLPPKPIGPPPAPQPDLQIKITQLQGMLDDLKTKNDQTQADKTAAEKKAADAAAAQANAEKVADDANIVSKKLADTNDITAKQLDDTNKKLGDVTKQKDDFAQQVKELALQKTTWEHLKQNVDTDRQDLDKFNIPYVSDWIRKMFGTTWAGFLSAVFGMLASGTLFTTVWHRYVLPFLMKKLGWFPTKIIDAVGRRALGRYVAQKKTEKSSDKPVENVYNNSVEDISVRIINNEAEKPAPTPVTPPTPASKEEPSNPVIRQSVDASDHIYQLFVSGGFTLQGITPQEYCIKAGFYKTAVNMLKAGNLLNMKNAQPFNNIACADAIDAYVTNRFMETTLLPTFEFTPTIAHDAYVGYLYKQGVDLLRQGKFQIIGDKDAAIAIDKYVQDEFMKKLGK